MTTIATLIVKKGPCEKKEGISVTEYFKNENGMVCQKEYCCHFCAEEGGEHKLCHHCGKNSRKFWLQEAFSQDCKIKISAICGECDKEMMSDDGTSGMCCMCKQEAARTKLCSGCRKAHYCSRECQKLDWPRHKPICLRFRQN